MSTQMIDAAPVEPGPSPVFVDGTGRRARLARRAAWTLAACCVVYLVVFGVSVAAGPVGPGAPIGRFPELTPATTGAGPVDPTSPARRSGTAATRARSTAVAPPPATAPPPTIAVVPTATPTPIAPPTSGVPAPTSSAVPPTTETSAPTTSAEPTGPSTSEPAPSSSQTAQAGPQAAAGADAVRTTLGGAA